MPAAETARRLVLGTVGPEARQAVHEHRGEVLRQVFDRHVGLGRPACRFVHPDLLGRLRIYGRRLPVGERHRRRVSLRDRPLVEQPQHAHVLVPRLRPQMPFGITAGPVHRVDAQQGLQPVPRVEDPHPMSVRGHRPVPQDPRVRPPRRRCRTPRYRQQSQPLVDQRQREPLTIPTLEPQVVTDQHCHALRDQRLRRQPPRLPALSREERHIHDVDRTERHSPHAQQTRFWQHSN